MASTPDRQGPHPCYSAANPHDLGFDVGNWEIWAFLGVGLIAAVALLWFARRPGSDTGFAELAGRLAQMADASAAAQAALAASLNERLDALGKRVGDSLTESTAKSSETLSALHQRLAVIDAAQKNISELSGKVVSLQDILSNKQARGAFGEIQLGDLVRDMLPPSAYQLQATLGNGKRVDCLITLPNPHGAIAIDSKFPLEGYRALREARDEATQTVTARVFTADLRKHIDDIATRYIVPGETAEFAIMFLPSEAVFLELHANFIQIVEHGHRARVIIVSPSTMWATLNAIRAILKDARMQEQAGVIQQEVLKLVKDVVRLQDRTENLRKHFANIETDVREIEISAGKIADRAEKIEHVQLTDTVETIAELPQGSATARILP